MEHRYPASTVDIIIEFQNGIVLVERHNEPRGWALPGGFIDYGEAAEIAAIREAYEETGLSVVLRQLLGVYSEPDRDPRRHTISTVYVGQGAGELKAGDDASNVKVVGPRSITDPLCFDHGRIIEDYLEFLSSGTIPAPRTALTKAERESLINVARNALSDAVSGDSFQAPISNIGRLDLPGACFVTLRRHGNLRGCIGIMTPERSLAEVTGSMAKAAALRDTRFQPVQPEELDSIELEISVLGPSVPIGGPQDIQIGKHGLVVSKGFYRGVLLPQVATDHDWDPVTFLRQTCIKAGLSPEAWKDPKTTIEAFTAEIIEEGEA